MKGDVVRNAIDAHGWVGLIISVPLFIIFWSGALTLYHIEFDKWASMPHFPVTKQIDAQQTDLNQLVDSKLKHYLFDNSRVAMIYLPSDESPYFKMRIPTYDSPELAAQAKAQISIGNNLEDKSKKAPVSSSMEYLLIDPISHKVLADNSPFEFSYFLDQLHFTLKLPQGLYIVGVVTFFFLVIVFTGIVIQLKNMIRNFFLYRHNKATRYKMNDIHNVVGVISLPYGLMYAVTGIMFNLSILFQIPTLLVLYQGDMQALMLDAGLSTPQKEISHIEQQMPDLNALLNMVEEKYDAKIQRINFIHYNDKNAVLRFAGTQNNTFAKRINAYYDVETKTFPEDLNAGMNNNFSNGVRILYNIHMANFAGVDLRLIYFILAIGVCGMIIAGNVLWIAKRQKKAEYPKTMAATRGLTLGGCVGVVIATSFGLLLERTLPVALDHRHDYVIYSFGIVLLASVIIAFFNSNYKKFVAAGFISSSAFLLLLSINDLAIHSFTIIELWQNQFTSAGGISISIFICSILLGFIGFKIYKHDQLSKS